VPLGDGQIGHVGPVGQGSQGVDPGCLAALPDPHLSPPTGPVQVELPALIGDGRTGAQVVRIGAIGELADVLPRHQRPDMDLGMPVAQIMPGNLVSATHVAPIQITSYNAFHQLWSFQSWSWPRTWLQHVPGFSFGRRWAGRACPWSEERRCPRWSGATGGKAGR